MARGPDPPGARQGSVIDHRGRYIKKYVNRLQVFPSWHGSDIARHTVTVHFRVVVVFIVVDIVSGTIIRISTSIYYFLETASYGGMDAVIPTQG